MKYNHNKVEKKWQKKWEKEFGAKKFDRISKLCII